MRTLKKLALVGVISAVMANPAFSQMEAGTLDNLVNFQTTLDRSVETDRWEVVLFTQNQSANLMQANQGVNQKLNQANEIIKKYPSLKAINTNISSMISYNSKTNKQDGWTVRGRMILNAQDSVKLAQALSELQGVMAIQNISAQISPEKLVQVQSKMTTELLAKFRQQAKFLADNLQAKCYKIISLNFEDFSGDIAPRTYAVSLRAMPANNVGIPSNLISSQQNNVRMSISAKIQLMSSCTPPNSK